MTLANAEVNTAGTNLNIYPLVLDGAAPVQTGAATATFKAGTNTDPSEITITTTTTGSWVLICGAATDTTTILANTANLFVSSNGGPYGGYQGFGVSASATGTPGSTTFGWPTANQDFVICALEILPAAAAAPPALAVSTAFPAPAVITHPFPATLAASASFPAPAAGNPAPGALAVTAAFPAPVVRQDRDITPAALAVPAIPAVILGGGAGGAAAGPGGAGTGGAGGTGAVSGTAGSPGTRAWPAAAGQAAAAAGKAAAGRCGRAGGGGPDHHHLHDNCPGYSVCAGRIRGVPGRHGQRRDRGHRQPGCPVRIRGPARRHGQRRDP